VKISIIVPVLNEADSIASGLDALAALRARGHELIVVDGGSEDATVSIARGRADSVLEAPRGRASQMNAGAARASGEVLVFLHADTRLPGLCDRLIADGLSASGRLWGRFDVAIEGRSALLGLVAAMMNARSRASGIATGDQAMFVRREAFERAGRFPAIAIMEDIALSRSLKALSPPLCIRERARTSGRRWDNQGVIRTIVSMWWLRLQFFFGAESGRLARSYEGRNRRHA
jgi:rSAM/selenodomain-associated transferase 2